MDEIQKKIYIAGIMDSGCRISIGKYRGRYTAMVCVQRQEVKMVEIIREVFGGAIIVDKKGHGRYRLSGINVVRMLEMENYMLTRSVDWRILREFLSLPKGRKCMDEKERLHLEINMGKIEHMLDQHKYKIDQAFKAFRES